MFIFHLKIVAIACIFLKFTVMPVLGGHAFMIKKSEGSFPDNMSEVRLSRTTPKPTSQWSQNIDFFFPQACEDLSKGKKYYQVTIDLEGFTEGPLLNISKFLMALAEKQAVNSFSPLLVLKNGTSYKFNKIFHGVKAFFKNTQNAEVHYYHTGIQAPCAAEKGLGSLATIKQIAERSVDVSDSLNQLTHGIARLTLSNKSRASSLSKVTEAIFNDDSEASLKEVKTKSVKTKSVKTKFSVKMLQKLVQYEEVEEKIEPLKKQWHVLKGGEWPPLGVINPNQIKQTHIGSLEEFLRGKYPEPTLVLEVSGLTGEDDIQSVIELCWKTPSIRCLRIRDSACILSSFVAFCDPQDEDEKSDSVEPLLLNKDKIRFLDVQTALKGGVDSGSSPECFGYQQEIFDKYFVWISLEDNRLKHLNEEAQKTHQLFGVFAAYLDLLQSEFEQSNSGAL